MQPQDFDALESILDGLRMQEDETPRWEFCEGFMAALAACRREISPDHYLPVLLGQEASNPALAEFVVLWNRRWDEVSQALRARVDTLEDPRAYHPEVVDLRGAVAALPQEERDALKLNALPSFAQVWAIGFMYAVENWPQEWTAPDEPGARAWFDRAVGAIVTLTEDDADEPTISPFGDGGVASVSAHRLDDFGLAVWAVYDLHALWH